jgi:hypothetical protein
MNRHLFAAGIALCATGAMAQPVKCVDAKGHVRYIDQSMMAQEKCQPVRAQTNIVTTQPGAIAPRPPASAKAGNDADAREAAVRQAEAGLEAAKKALAEQEAIRTGEEHNYARVQERLKPYQDAVEQAQQNLAAARQAAR